MKAELANESVKEIGCFYKLPFCH